MTTLRLLLSFAYAPSIDLPRILDAAKGMRVELFADSGAYTADTTGKTIRLADYAAWIHDLGPLVTVAANLDVRGDHVASARNQDALERLGVQAMPVFHFASPFSELERLCARHRYVAIGGMGATNGNLPLRMRWLVRCFRIAAEHGTVFHGFGHTQPPALARLPYYSVDSSTWTAGSRYARMIFWDERAARFRELYFGGKQDLRPHRALITKHLGDADVLAAPGCAVLAKRDRAAYWRDLEMVYRVSVVATRRFETWLQARHAVPPPPGLTSTGTCVFLAATRMKDILFAIDAVRALASAQPAT